MTSGRYPYGTDYEWFAVDAAGQIGVFTSAGVGPIPVSVLTARETADKLARFVRGIPAHGGGSLLVELPRPDDYARFARQGFYAYDWADVHRVTDKTQRYELYSRPDIPSCAGDLPEEFRALLEATCFHSLRFADSRSIDVWQHLVCEPNKA